MKFLVTGFRPFGGRNINSSWLAVQNLTADVNGNEIRTCELPVSYTESDKVLIEAIEREHPDAVLCVGQNASISCIHVETTAENYAHSDEPDEDNNLWLYRSIDMLGNPSYRTNLPAEDICKNIKNQDIDAEVSNFAGTFVCNYVMYRLLQYREEKAPELAAGFIHVPCVPEQCVGRFSGNPGMPLEQIVAALTTAINTIAGTTDVRTKPESRNSGMTKPEISPDVPKEPETAPAAEISPDVPKEPETAPAAEILPDVPKGPETAPAAEILTDVPKEPETAPEAESSTDGPKMPETTPITEISLDEPKEPDTAPITEISLDEPKEPVTAELMRDTAAAVVAEAMQSPAEGKVSVGEELWKLRAGVPKQPPKPAPRPANINAVEYREGFPGQPMLTGDYRVFRVDDKFKGAEPEEHFSLHQYMEDNIPVRPKTQIEQIREMRENRIREREEIRRFFRNGETEDEYKERCRKSCQAESEKKHMMYGDIQVLNENVYGAGVSLTRDWIVDNSIFRVRETVIKEGGLVVGYHLTEMNTSNSTVIREIGDFPAHLMDFETYYLYLALTEMKTLKIQPDTLEVMISDER